jgi:hypothetical protein
MAARLMVMSCGGGEGGMPTRHTPGDVKGWSVSLSPSL